MAGEGVGRQSVRRTVEREAMEEEKKMKVMMMEKMKMKEEKMKKMVMMMKKKKKRKSPRRSECTQSVANSTTDPLSPLTSLDKYAKF
jgi:hypothetical protein